MKKKITLFACVLCAAACAQAYYMVCGQTSDDSVQVWSSCVWTNDEQRDAKPLPTKPGPRDDVNVRAGKTLKCDVDVNINKLTTGTAGKLYVDGEKKVLKFNVKRMLHLRQSTEDSQSLMEFKNTELNVGGALSLGPVTSDQHSLGMGSYRFINSNANINGGLNVILSCFNLKNSQGKGGLEMYLEGKSKVIIKDDAVLDPCFLTDENTAVQFVFRERNGNIPFLQIKDIDPKAIDVSISIRSDMKRGKYPILEVLNNKFNPEELKSLRFKGRTYKLGTEFKLGDRKASIVADSAGRGSKNDLILVVE